MEASLHSNVQTRQDIARDIVRDSIISRYMVASESCISELNMAEAFDGHILESSTRHQNVAEQIGMSCKKKNIVFRNLVWHDLVYSLFLSQFRRLALQACDELKSKYL